MSNVFDFVMSFLKTKIDVFGIPFSFWGIMCTFFAVYLFKEILCSLKGGK